MPLEPCPICGYALSVAEHRCRHCEYMRMRTTVPQRRSFEKHISTVIVAVVALLAILAYYVFFR